MLYGSFVPHSAVFNTLHIPSQIWIQSHKLLILQSHIMHYKTIYDEFSWLYINDVCRYICIMFVLIYKYMHKNDIAGLHGLKMTVSFGILCFSLFLCPICVYICHC